MFISIQINVEKKLVETIFVYEYTDVFIRVLFKKI